MGTGGNSGWYVTCSCAVTGKLLLVYIARGSRANSDNSGKLAADAARPAIRALTPLSARDQPLPLNYTADRFSAQDALKRPHSFRSLRILRHPSYYFSINTTNAWIPRFITRHANTPRFHDFTRLAQFNFLVDGTYREIPLLERIFSSAIFKLEYFYFSLPFV